MKLPIPPQISRYPGLRAEPVTGKDGSPLLRVTSDSRDHPKHCDAQPACPQDPCRHTKPMAFADRDLTAAGWRMKSGRASQDGPESRLYQPPGTPGPERPTAAPQPATSAPRSRQPSLWDSPPDT